MRKIVLVEPEEPENTGFIARLCSNFDFQLRLVNPEFNLEEARKTANNAQGKLREAEIFETVEEAIKDLEYVVGTKPDKGSELSNFTFRENTSIMLGRESSGLTNQELELCDATIHIKADYKSLNLSHAASIMMYQSQIKREGLASSERFAELENRCGEKEIELIKRASPNKKELDKLLGEL